jgi:3-deoxy-D-manno-octulosonic-acid transferase
MRILYQLFVFLYGLSVRIAALFSRKAGQWIKGRKAWKDELMRSIPADRPVCWMHCASLGEFEQGKPVLERIRKESPDHFILLTFFSPSGYEVRKSTPLADKVMYLPLDSPSNARFFLKWSRPSLILFVKYEFWYFFLREAKKSQAKTYLISGLFRPSQLFFRPYGHFFRKILHSFDHFFVQNKESADLLHSIGIEGVTVAGDNRIDSVAQNAAAAGRFEAVESFCGKAPVIICGSTHDEDEPSLLPFLNDHLPEAWKIVFAPHEIKKTKLERLKKNFEGQAIFFSEWKKKERQAKSRRVLIIDNVGMLAQLYQYGRLAYIGGGFGRGIHNLLEPMAFGLPCLFGPKYQKFEEAQYLVRAGAGHSVRNKEELKRAFDQLLQAENYTLASEKARSYILSSQGATEKVIHGIGL